MDKLFALFNPYRWWAAIGAVVVVIGGFWWAVHAYNSYVSEKAVAAALVKERAVEAPKLKTAQAELSNLKTQVITDRLNATSAANAAIAQGKLDALNKTNIYVAEIKALKSAAAHAADQRASADRDADARLRDATRPLAAGDGSGQQGVRLSGYTNGLASLYGQCEKDVGVLIETAAGALDRLASAEAAVRALSPAK